MMAEWIISSSILICVVIGVRFLFKGKISLRLQYALWALVLVRLLFPFSFGSTDISVINLTENAKEQPAVQAVIDIGNLNVPSQSYEDAYNQVVQKYESQGIDVGSLQGSELEALEYEAYDRMEGQDISEIVGELSRIVWVIGIALVGIVFLATNSIFRRKLLRSRYDLDIMSNGLGVYVTNEIDTPCLFGIRNPAIYVTYEAADDSKILRHTIAHEITHYRHGDHIWSILRCVCLALHWYNPLVWCAAFLSQRDAELACDEATIRKLGEGERADYGRTLIGMTCQKRTNVLITATTMTTSESGIKERILLIAKKPKMALYTLVAVILIAFVAVGCTFTGAKEEEMSHEDMLSEFFEAYNYELVKGRMVREEVHYIGSTEEYALVFNAGEGPSLDLYRYEIEGDRVSVIDSAGGDYAISGGLSVNHLIDGDKHIYYGTVSDYHWMPQSDSRLPLNWKSLMVIDENGVEHEIEMTGKEGYLCVLDAPMEDFFVIEHEDTIGIGLTMASYLNQGYQINETKFATQIDIGTEIIETNPVETEPPEATIGLPELGTLYEELDDSKVCIAVLPTGVSTSGGDFKYIIPENQDKFLEAYQAALARAEEELSWDNNLRCSGWWVCYEDQWWQVMEGGTMYGDGMIAAEDAKPLYELCVSAVQQAGIGAPVRPEEITGIKSATLYWNGTHTVTDTYALSKIQTWFTNSREIRSASCWFTGMLVLELENGETKTIMMATDSCATWMSEGVVYSYGEYTDDGITGNEEFFSLFAASVIHEKAKEGMDALQDYWAYLNWSRYANAYGPDETFALMDKFKEFVISAPYDWNMLTAMRATKGLDGAYADYYAAILADLFEADKSVFSFACLGMASDPDEATILEMLAYHWNMSTDEVRAKLEAERPQN